MDAMSIVLPLGFVFAWGQAKDKFRDVISVHLSMF
jgi:hypothetical protein